MHILPQITTCFVQQRGLRKPHRCISVTVLLALCLAGCQSKDTIAANRAAEAQADLDQGRISAASRAVRQAIAARDDVLDTWLLKAHIDLRAGDRPGAFSDYEYALQFDHANMEALQALCELGVAAGSPEAVDGYADQLLILAPGSEAALIAKGAVAETRHDLDGAEAMANRVLSQHPENLAAISLKTRILLDRGRFADAAALIGQTPDTPDNRIAKLKLLQSVYDKAHDRPSYDRTLRQLGEAAPNDADVQLGYADLLYQDGQNDLARGVIRKTMAANPASLRIAAEAFKVWMEAGPQALDIRTMVADAAHTSLLMKADYAQFANETGHPEVAIAILQGADQGETTAQNSNAKAALAYAMALTGHGAEALTQLNSILDRDSSQPWALLARARLEAAAKDYLGAVRDARLLVANDRGNATAHLALADILSKSGDADLSIIALREGLRAIPTSARLAARLAATLSARGDRGQAAQVALDLYRTAAMDQRARNLLQTYDPSALATAPAS